MLSSTELKKLQKSRRARQPLPGSICQKGQTASQNFDDLNPDKENECTSSISENKSYVTPSQVTVKDPTSTSFTILGDEVVSNSHSKSSRDSCLDGVKAILGKEKDFEKYQSFLKSTITTDNRNDFGNHNKKSKKSQLELTESSSSDSLKKSLELTTSPLNVNSNPFENLEVLYRKESSQSLKKVLLCEDFSSSTINNTQNDFFKTNKIPRSPIIPFDWNLKKAITIQSSHSFHWIKGLKTTNMDEIEALALDQLFFRHNNNNNNLSLSTCQIESWTSSSDTVPMILSLYECLFYWIFPQEAAIDKMSLNYILLNGNIPQSRSTENQGPWETAIDSALNLWRLKKLKYFYVIHGDINALFLENDAGILELRLRCLDRRHVKLLDDYHLINSSKLEGSEKVVNNDAEDQLNIKLSISGTKEADMTNVLAEMKEIETTAPGSTKIHRASPLYSTQKSIQYESILNDDKPLSFVGLDSIKLVFELIKKILRNTSICPIIISPRPFLLASLQKNQIKIHRSIRRIIPVASSTGSEKLIGNNYSEESIHKLSIYGGILLPSCVNKLLNIFRATQLNQLETSFVPDINSIGFNTFETNSSLSSLDFTNDVSNDCKIMEDNNSNIFISPFYTDGCGNEGKFMKHLTIHGDEITPIFIHMNTELKFTT